MDVKESGGSLKPEANLNLNLNLSPPRQGLSVPAHESISSTEISPRSSCVSQEGDASPDETMVDSSSSECSGMMVVGCPRCLMYVVLLMEDPKCPKCKSTVLLDFLQVDNK